MQGSSFGRKNDGSANQPLRSNKPYLDELLPNSEIHSLDAGHFAWEQVPEEYGRLIVDWVGGGYRRVAKG